METLTSFLDAFGVDEFGPLMQLKKKYYSASSEVKEVVDAVDMRPEWAGQYWGEEGKTFIPSPALLAWVVKHTDRKVVVDEKVGYLFSCGRDILDVDVKHNYVVVVDSSGRVLGYGHREKGGVKNLWDVGDFLRRESKKGN